MEIKLRAIGVNQNSVKFGLLNRKNEQNEPKCSVEQREAGDNTVGLWLKAAY